MDEEWLHIPHIATYRFVILYLADLVMESLLSWKPADVRVDISLSGQTGLLNKVTTQNPAQDPAPGSGFELICGRLQLYIELVKR